MEIMDDDLLDRPTHDDRYKTVARGPIGFRRVERGATSAGGHRAAGEERRGGGFVVSSDEFEDEEEDDDEDDEGVASSSRDLGGVTTPTQDGASTPGGWEVAAPGGGVLPEYPDEYAATLKVLVIGASGVGKTALLFRYCDRGFDSYVNTTVGVDYKMKDLMVSGKAYRLNIFDTAGQERFHSLGTSHYRGAHAVLLAYDLSNRATFDALDRWFDEARAHAPEGAVLGLVGTKLDRAGPPASSSLPPSPSLVEGGDDEGRQVSFAEGQAKAAARGAAVFCEVSALTGEGVTAPFRGLVAEVLRTPGLVEAIGRRPWPAAGRAADPHPYRTLAGELVGGGVRVVGEVAGVGVRVVRGKVAGVGRCWC